MAFEGDLLQDIHILEALCVFALESIKLFMVGGWHIKCQMNEC